MNTPSTLHHASRSHSRDREDSQADSSGSLDTSSLDGFEDTSPEPATYEYHNGEVETVAFESLRAAQHLVNLSSPSRGHAGGGGVAKMPPRGESYESSLDGLDHDPDEDDGELKFEDNVDEYDLGGLKGRAHRIRQLLFEAQQVCPST
jgi:hypothetical protein